MIKQLRVKTNSRTELVDITQGVQRLVAESGVRSGVCYVYVPHTTAGGHNQRELGPERGARHPEGIEQGHPLR